MTGYYDVVLGLIPLSLAGLTALLFVAGTSLAVAIPMASVVTVGLIGHAMFVNAPVAEPSVARGAGSPPVSRTEAGPGNGPSAD